MVYNFLPLLFNAYFRLQFEINRIWISLHRLIFQTSCTTSTKSSSSINCNNNIVIIGDSFGYGIGDSFFTCESAGIGYSLYYQIQIESSIRTQWTLTNYSSFKSTTNDWLPHKINKNDYNGLITTNSSLFEKNKKHIQNSSIVILFMGTQDMLQEEEEGLLLPDAALLRSMQNAIYPPEEISSIVSNIVKICKELQSMKKHVLVIDLPTEGLETFGRGKIRRINQQLKQAIKQENSLSTDDTNKIELISLGSNHRIMRPHQNEDTHCPFHPLHLNRKGYELLAYNIFQNGLKNMIVLIEWMKWKVLFEKDSKYKIKY